MGQPRRLRDQVWVITGGSSGIGRATARMAAQRGARVVVASRDAADLRAAVDDIRGRGGDVTFAVCDVADHDSVRKVAETAVRRYGRIDTWFNNAGVSVYGWTRDVPIEDARRIFDTNYWGIVHGSLVALEHLSATGGVLLNMGSMASERAIPLQGHYSASKQAVHGFTDTLRMEVEEEGLPVTVTLLKPGAIDTPYPQHARSYLDREPKHPSPVYAPETVARAALFCAEHPRRDIVVGGGGQLMTAMGLVASRLTDRYMESTMFEGQMRDRPRADERADALHAPRPGDAAERGTQPGHVLRTSAWTEARLRPGLALLGSAAVLVAAGLAGRMMMIRR